MKCAMQVLNILSLVMKDLKWLIQVYGGVISALFNGSIAHVYRATAWHRQSTPKRA